MTEKKHTNRQAIRSRNMLQDALLELLRARPYHKITITSITETAGLTRPTFYAHFATKDDLLMSYVDDILDDFFQELRAGVLPLREHQAEVIEGQTGFFRQWKENADILRLIRTVDIDLRIMNRLRDYHLETYHDIIAPAHPELNPTLIGYYIDFLSAATFGLLRHWMDANMDLSPALLGDMLHDLAGAHQMLKLMETYGNVVK